MFIYIYTDCFATAFGGHRSFARLPVTLTPSRTAHFHYYCLLI